MPEIEFSAGTHVSEAARRLAYDAMAYQQTYTGEFNEITMVANPGDSPESVEAAWRAESDRRAEEYRNSDEYKALQAALVNEDARMQHLADQHMATLPSLDMTDINAVLTWLTKLLETANGGNSFIDWYGVVEALGKNGYEANVNCGDNFNAEDADNCGRWLIGQFMNMVTDGRYMNTLNNIFGKHAKEWQDKFVTA